jgi:hypothetical protein
MKLNEHDLQILRNKLPRQEIQRKNILLELDVAFNFNRTKLAEFLANNGLIGYSRTHLYKILGPPVLRADEYRTMKKVFIRIGKPDLLPLIVSRGVWRNFFTGSLGSVTGSDKNP